MLYVLSCDLQFHTVLSNCCHLWWIFHTLCVPTLWQASLCYLILFHLLKCGQATVQLLAPHSTHATTSTLELLSTSVASSLTQVMPSLVTSTRTGWWSEMGTWWTQHWQKQSFQPPRRVSSCSSSTSNQSMTVSTTALPTQVIQMKRCPVTCTSMDQVRTACGDEVEGPWGGDAACILSNSPLNSWLQKTQFDCWGVLDTVKVHCHCMYWSSGHKFIHNVIEACIEWDINWWYIAFTKHWRSITFWPHQYNKTVEN